MGTFFFSGIEKTASAQVLVDEQAAGMISRLQYSDSLMELCKRVPILLTMDCGSFTAPLTDDDIRAYARLILKVHDYFLWFAMPDVIGDQERSHRNYIFLLSLLPQELHYKVLYIYQYGSDTKYLFAALRSYARIGIGGLVPLMKSDRDRAYQAIVHLALSIRRYNVVPHFFGVSSKEIILMLHEELKDFTVDSTTWLVAGRYGLLIDNNGKQIPISSIGQFNFSTTACLAQNVKTMRAWVEKPPSKQKASPMEQLRLFGDKAQDDLSPDEIQLLRGRILAWGKTHHYPGFSFPFNHEVHTNPAVKDRRFGKMNRTQQGWEESMRLPHRQRENYAGEWLTKAMEHLQRFDSGEMSIPWQSKDHPEDQSETDVEILQIAI